MNLVLNFNDIVLRYYNNSSEPNNYYIFNGFIHLLSDTDYQIIQNYIKSIDINIIYNKSIDIKLTDIYVQKQINIKHIENPNIFSYIINGNNTIPSYINYHMISHNNQLYLLINNYLIQINKSDYSFLANYFLIFILDQIQFSKYNDHIKISLNSYINTPCLINNIFDTFGLNIYVHKYKEFFNYLNMKTIYIHHIEESIIKTTHSEYPVYILDNYKFSFFYSDEDIILIPQNILMSYYRKYNYSPYELLVYYLIRTNINNLVINHNLDKYNKINLFGLFYADDQNLLKTKILNYNTIESINNYSNLNKSICFKNLVDIKIDDSYSGFDKYIFDKHIKYGENLYIKSSIDISKIEVIFEQINNSKINYLDISFDPINKIVSINNYTVHNFSKNDYLYIYSYDDIQSLKLVKTIKNNNLINISEFVYCMCIHVGNIFLLDELIGYLSKLTYNYDLYITIDKQYNLLETPFSEFIKEKIDIIKMLNPNTTILYIDNVGADIYPFLYTYKYILDLNIKYKYILKVHTKSDTRWRKRMYESVFNNNIVNIVKNLDRFGMYGHKYVNYDYLNHYYLVQILNMISCYFFKNQQMDIFKSNIEIDIHQSPNKKILSNAFKFVPGTVFWIKFDILSRYPKFVNLINITNTEFNKDYIYQQKLHAIERLFGILVYMSGYVL